MGLFPALKPLVNESACDDEACRISEEERSGGARPSILASTGLVTTQSQVNLCGRGARPLIVGRCEVFTKGLLDAPAGLLGSTHPTSPFRLPPAAVNMGPRKSARYFLRQRISASETNPHCAGTSFTGDTLFRHRQSLMLAFDLMVVRLPFRTNQSNLCSRVKRVANRRHLEHVLDWRYFEHSGSHRADYVSAVLEAARRPSDAGREQGDSPAPLPSGPS